MVPRFEFSLSHTHGLVALIVAYADHVGIDVEFMERTNDLERVAQRVCSRSELESLGQFSGEAWKKRFFELWTLKEAYAKARGLGLALPLQRVSFAIDREENVVSQEAPDWQFYLKRLPTNHMLAAAVYSSSRDQIEFQFRPVRLTSS